VSNFDQFDVQWLWYVRTMVAEGVSWIRTIKNLKAQGTRVREMRVKPSIDHGAREAST
jgi:hypothetical protein